MALEKRQLPEADRKVAQLVVLSNICDNHLLGSKCIKLISIFINSNDFWQMLHRLSGFIDTDKIHPNACPALVADLSSGDQGIIALAFGNPV